MSDTSPSSPETQRETAVRKPWRVGNHYNIHVYAGDTPVATFHRPEWAMQAVADHNAALSAARTEGEVPSDVIRLVVAARHVAFDAHPSADALRELDAASEAFADRVSWDDEPLVDATTEGGVQDGQFLIRRGGYFFRPRARGYTSSVGEAGLFPREVAEDYRDNCEGISIYTRAEWDAQAPSAPAPAPREEDGRDA